MIPEKIWALWQTDKIDSLSISLAIRLRKECKPGQKIVFVGSRPVIREKTRMDKILERIFGRKV
jgi:hypothetical protein